MIPEAALAALAGEEIDQRGDAVGRLSGRFERFVVERSLYWKGSWKASKFEGSVEKSVAMVNRAKA